MDHLITTNYKNFFGAEKIFYNDVYLPKLLRIWHSKKNSMVTKYFVEVIASNKQQLINLQKFELDLFQPTAKSIDDKEFKIDGLISLDDINKLVENGYKVVIKNESMKKTPAVQETTSFQEWSETAKKRERRRKRTIRIFIHIIVYRIFDFRGNRFCTTIHSQIISIISTINCTS